MSYFFLAVIKYHDQRKRVYLGLWFQRAKHPLWQRGMTASSSQNNWSRKLRAYILYQKLKVLLVGEAFSLKI